MQSSDRNSHSKILMQGIPVLAGIWLLAAWGVGPALQNDLSSGSRSDADLFNSGKTLIDTLHIGIVYSGNFLPLPPAMLTDGPERWIMSQVYGPGLVLPSNRINGSEPPELALASEMSPGVTPGITTFSLKEMVRFHDGTILTLDDFISTFDIYRRLVAEDNPVVDPAFEWIESVGIDTERNQLVLEMPPWMDVQPRRVASVAPLAHNLDELNSAGINEQLVGLGGYTYTLSSEQTAGGRRGVIHLQAFEGYLPESPEIKNVAVHLYPNDRELIQAYITGRVHVARLPTFHAATSLEELLKGSAQERSALTRMYPRPNHFFFLAFNNTLAPFDNPKVRSALVRAINRKAMADEPPFASVITDFPVHPRSNLGRNLRSSAAAYIPTAARRLLNEAGLMRGGEARTQTGDPIRLTLIYPNHVTLYEEMALRIKNDLQRLGFRVDAEPLSPEIVRARMREGDYMFALSEITLSPTAESISRLFHSSNIENGLNFTRFRSVTFNSAVDGFLRREAPNLESFLESALRLLGDEYPLIPLFYQANEYYVFNNSVLNPDNIALPLRRLNPIAEWKWR